MKMTKTSTLIAASIAALIAATSHAAEFTAPGTQLAVGESAVIPLRIPYKPQVPVRVTVTAIDEGTLADFGQYKVPPEAADSRPYYVRYTITALAPGEYSGVTLGYTLAVDDRGQEHTATLLDSRMSGASFDRCNAIGAFKAGDTEGSTREGCRIFLVHKNGSMTGFRFKEFETPYNKSPVTWMVGSAASKPAAGEPTIRPGN